MDYRSYEFVSKDPKTPEYAVLILNQHVRQWYANPMRTGGDRYDYEQLLPHGDSITTLTNLYKKNPGADWEWNNDDDYLVTSTQWPEGSAIFYDSDEETWHTVTPSPDFEGAWVTQGGITAMDAAIFPEELIPQHTGPELTADAIKSVIEGALLHAQILSLIDGALIKARRGQ